MKIKTVKVGYLETNCYIASIDNDCLIIDPGDEVDKIINEIGNLKPVGIIITHYHFDHIGALKELVNKYNVKVYDYKLEEKEYTINNFEFKIIHTKGHDDTCITIYFEKEKIIFVGDFIFKDSIGRIDLENSNKLDMFESINKIKKYPNDIILYPGHGEITNLGYEKENNIYFKNAQ